MCIPTIDDNPLTCAGFPQGHDDDIRSMALHPNRRFVATGQVASALDGSADDAYVTVWDAMASPPARLQRLPFKAARFIVALAFSPCGNRLVVRSGYCC